jgi:hypothetical protein
VQHHDTHPDAPAHLREHVAGRKADHGESLAHENADDGNDLGDHEDAKNQRVALVGSEALCFGSQNWHKNERDNSGRVLHDKEQADAQREALGLERQLVLVTAEGRKVGFEAAGAKTDEDQPDHGEGTGNE